MSVAALLSNVLDAGSTPAISTRGPFERTGFFVILFTSSRVAWQQQDSLEKTVLAKAGMNTVHYYFLSGLPIQNRLTLFPDELFPDKKIPISQHFLWHAQ